MLNEQVQTRGAVTPAAADQVFLKYNDLGDIRVDSQPSQAFLDTLFEPSKTAYALVDAARAQSLPEWLGGTGSPHECLFTGEALDTLGPVAPWLIQLDPEAPMLKAMFTKGEKQLLQLWGADAGIFLRTAAPLKTVCKHLRRLTRLRGPDDAWVYFRFWDPTVAHGYFPAIANWQERVDSIFQSRHLQDLDILIPNASANTARHVERTAPASSRLATSVPPAQLRLTHRDTAIFEARQLPQLRTELADWLVRLDPQRFRPFGPARRDAIAGHALTEGARFGFTFKEEYAHLLYMMSFLGGWFHTAPDYAPFLDGWTDPHSKRYETMRMGFVKAYEAAFPDPNARQNTLETLYNYASFIPGGVEHAGPADVQTLSDIAEQLLPAGASPDPARHEVTQTCANMNLSDARVKCLFYLMRLVLGPNPLNDPFQPWVRDKLFASGPRLAKVALTADFALRRLRHLI